MSETVNLSARVSQELAEALNQIAVEARTSKSELIRDYLRNAVLEGEEEVPGHLTVQLEREKLKAKNGHVWQKVYFRSNVAERFRNAFEQGDLDGEMGDSAVEDIRRIYVEDAEALFQNGERKEDAIAFVNAVAEHAKEASDASEFDRLDPGEMFERYGGVEHGRHREATDLEAVIADARERIERLRQSPSATFRPEDLARSLSKVHGITEDLAKQAVEQAAEGDA